MGYVNFQSLMLLHKYQILHGFPKIAQLDNVCGVFLISKQTRRSFSSKATYSAEKVLHPVHGDLCGPIEPTTSGGNKYFLLLVDDFSRAMWVYIIKNIYDTLDAFKKSF